MNHLLLTILITTSGINCFADWNNGPDYHQLVTCSTYSNGLTFQETERDSGLARQLSTSHCTADNRTNNSECAANEQCSDSPPRPWIKCATYSNGLTFQKQELDRDLAQRLSISACTTDNRTNNSECSANISCDGDFRQSITCNTFSNGLTFSKTEQNANLASQLAISSCTTNNNTNNSECAANVSCDGDQRHSISCNTFSNGLTFSKTELNTNLASQLAISSCTSNNNTNNSECSANISCDGDYRNPITCNTFSNGLTFSKTELNADLASRLAISQCTTDNRTNNSECAANIACGGNRHDGHSDGHFDHGDSRQPPPQNSDYHGQDRRNGDYHQNNREPWNPQQGH